MSNELMPFILEIMERERFNCQIIDGSVVFLAGYKAKRWKMVMDCHQEKQLDCFAVFPWKLSPSQVDRVVRVLNELNLSQYVGCFLLNPKDNRVVYRYSTPVLDIFSAREYIVHALLSCAAVVHVYWDTIYGLVGEEENHG